MDARWFGLGLLLVACGSASREAPPPAHEPPAHGAHQADEAHAVLDAPLAPRADLHCTPQRAGDEAACASRGDGSTYGPMPFDNGPARPDGAASSASDAYAQSYQAGTLPCACVPSGIVAYPSPAS